MFRTACSFAFALSLIASPVIAERPVVGPTTRISSGRLVGVRQGDAIAYLGIPYAAPPIGPNRWRSPRAVAPWKGVRAADRFGPSCPQSIVPSLGPWTHEYLPSGDTSEDCLSLNVWRPRTASKNLPVLVWIHGGGFTSGSASVPVYDGAAMAEKGIVVVSLNYRIGFLGSLARPELRNSGGGNFGIQDQIEALRWVRRNIAAFGGDSRRVTISGQSAGAFSVHYLMLAPGARGLFRQAIAQSGVGLGTGYDLWLDSRENAERSAVSLFEAAGARTLDEARALSLPQLTSAYFKAGGIPGSPSGFKTKPYADGAVLPLDPAAALKEGRYNDVPVLIGLTADEGSGLNPSYRLTDQVRYERFLSARYGVIASRLGTLYPLAKPYPAADGGSPMPSLIRDSGIAATVAWSKERNRTSRFPLYAYVWTHVEPGPEATRYAAFHTSEVPYVFATLGKAPERPFTREDWRISRIVQSYWLNFVKTGDPNGAGLPRWPVFGANRAIVELGGNFGEYRSRNAEAEAALVEHITNGHSLFGP
ncbi:carboxylesterase family protein [Novosphingobium sp. PS1R-30]|uniref:Carboxylic ester hydrolase n=1 Tax=Novosphingobium anseongense TaxID=3133436 RepID=A0ABU8S1D5_9SPHN